MLSPGASVPQTGIQPYKHPAPKPRYLVGTGQIRLRISTRISFSPSDIHYLAPIFLMATFLFSDYSCMPAHRPSPSALLPILTVTPPDDGSERCKSALVYVRLPGQSKADSVRHRWKLIHIDGMPANSVDTYLYMFSNLGSFEFEIRI